jgi:hypothetical protein
MAHALDAAKFLDIDRRPITWSGMFMTLNRRCRRQAAPLRKSGARQYPTSVRLDRPGRGHGSLRPLAAARRHDRQRPGRRNRSRANPPPA